MIKYLICISIFLSAASANSQGWQQKVDYKMDVELDIENHQFEGHQVLFYFNNSPDTLHKLYYHLYFNAFQPGSMMDVRSRTIADPDDRVRDRIADLSKAEEGFLVVDRLTMDGVPTEVRHDGTILEVRLPDPIAPHSVVKLDMDFRGQVPLQIRRSGRNNREGIDYSMAQWYPKLCEYDKDGWHPNPYVGREFYGVWGNYDVLLTLDAKYVVAATGILQNASTIGYGYSDAVVKHKKKDKITWHFKANNVHDFVWAADPDYTHTSTLTEDGVELHFFYQDGESYSENWEILPDIMTKAWSLIGDRFGTYPYPAYSFIQAGDGGMEYPMATLITGKRSIGSLVGVSVHELMHSWYQMLLGTNESLYPWMDEGFTSYATSFVLNELRKKKMIPGEYRQNPYVSTYNGYRNLIKSGLEEPMSTHSDHYMTNYAYGAAAYTKGAVFLHQLEYIVGKEVFDKALKDYYYSWRFRHPNDHDFIRIFEKHADLVLDWYLEYFVNSVKVIEYEVHDIVADDLTTIVELHRSGSMPMPVDVEVTYQDGSVSWHTIPLKIMRGAKISDGARDFTIEPDWPWTNPTYTFHVDAPIDEIKGVRIDPTLRLADFDLSNNLKEPADK